MEALGLLTGSPGLARAQTEAPPQKLDEAQGAALKVLKSLPNKYPDETVLKQIERMVVMEIVVDSNAKALSGPISHPTRVADRRQLRSLSNSRGRNSGSIGTPLPGENSDESRTASRTQVSFLCLGRDR
jgi:hypothetical protein